MHPRKHLSCVFASISRKPSQRWWNTNFYPHLVPDIVILYGNVFPSTRCTAANGDCFQVNWNYEKLSWRETCKIRHAHWRDFIRAGVEKVMAGRWGFSQYIHTLFCYAFAFRWSQTTARFNDEKIQNLMMFKGWSSRLWGGILIIIVIVEAVICF